MTAAHHGWFAERRGDPFIPVFLLVATRNAYLYRRATQLGLALH